MGSPHSEDDYPPSDGSPTSSTSSSTSCTSRNKSPPPSLTPSEDECPPQLEWPRRSRSCDSYLHKFIATKRAWKYTQRKTRQRFQGDFASTVPKPKRNDRKRQPRRSYQATQNRLARKTARLRRPLDTQPAREDTELATHEVIPATQKLPGTDHKEPTRRHPGNNQENHALKSQTESSQESSEIAWFGDTPAENIVGTSQNRKTRTTADTANSQTSPQGQRPKPTPLPASHGKQRTMNCSSDPFPPLPPPDNRAAPIRTPEARPPRPTDCNLHTVLFKPEDRRLSFYKLSPFSVGAATEHLDEIKDIRVNKARNIVAIDTSNAQTKHALLATTTLCGITVVPQLATKETHKITGVVRGIDIPGTAAELVPHIRTSQQILEANRSGNSLFLTFAGSTLPEHIYLANVRSPIQPTTPRPLQCYRCGRFNHIRVTCRHDTRCERCAGNHDEADCPEDQPKCANCHQDHKFSSPRCPQWQAEKRILMEAEAKNISKKQARFQLTATMLRDSRRRADDERTFAQAAANATTRVSPPPASQPSPHTLGATPVDPAITSMLSTAIETLATAIEIFKQHVRAT